MSSDSFLKQVLTGLAEALAPLKAAIASPQAFASFLGGFGWTLASSDLNKVTGSLGGLSTLAANPSSMSLEQLAGDLVSAANVIRSIASSGAPVAFVSTFPKELLDFQVYYALAQQSASIFSLLHFGGVLSEQLVPADSSTGRAEYVERLVNWNLLGQLADQPLSTFKQSYGWGAEFDADAFLRSLGILIQGFGGNAALFPADQGLVNQYYSRDSTSSAGTTNLILSIPSFQSPAVSRSVALNTKLALLFIPIPPTATTNAAPDGLAVMPVITGKATDAIAISDNVSLTLAGDFLTRPVRAEIHPNQAALRASTGDSSVDTSVRLDAKASVGSPWLAFGTTDSSRLEISAAHASFGFTGQLNGDIDIQAEVGLDTAALVIDLSEGDGFVKNAVGSQPTRTPFSLVFKWSLKSGFSVSGNPKLQITLPVMQSIGDVIQLQSIGFSLGAGSGSSFEFDATAALSVSIGPITAAISGLGATIQLSAPGNSAPPGNLGNADLSFGFKPPSGVGLSIDAAGVSGGGFLAYANGQYTGVLQLKFNDIALQAFGLITTQVAGANGYSLLALIDADFPPIQLGWGFTLNGVGGIMAANRTADVDAMRASLKANKISSILFPTNAITSAPQVLAQLDALFPTAQGRFLFGPMALIGWGTPTILTAALAVILELPEPVRIILLARITAALPSQSNALVRINMDALGVLDLTQDSLSLDATLFDSKLVGFTLSGDMSLRANWASNREFLLAIGGFHPQFTPPPGFPALNRITIDMPNGAITKMRLAAYLAIASNSLQFGANLDVFIGVAGFGLSGHLGFDALLQIDPFLFNADISGRVALTAGGDDLMSVGLDASLSGPAPWHIAGKFKVHIVFFTVHKSFSITWGGNTPAVQIPAVNVLPLLTAALADPRNWTTQPSSDTPTLVSVRSQDGSTLLVHPMAQLEVHETVVPLGLQITRFGSAAISGASTFTITDFSINGSTVMPQTAAVQDDFAPAQFFDLSDTDKLAGPSFEQQNAGLRLVSGSPSSGPAAPPKTIAYETSYIDGPGADLRPDAGTTQATLTVADLQQTLSIGASARADIRSAGKLQFQAPGNPVSIAPQKFAIANTSTLAFAGIGSASGTTYSGAKALLATAISKTPSLSSQLQIVAIHEMAAA